MAKQCSECGETFQNQGWPQHNRHMHNGEATGEPISPDGGGSNVPEGDGEGDVAGGLDQYRNDLGLGGSDDGTEYEPPEDDGGDDDDLADTFDDDGNEVDGDPDAGDLADDLDDDPDDARDYECGNCGAGVEYLGGADADGGGKECPECGERLLWSRVTA